jgi:hypothetical protein
MRVWRLCVFAQRYGAHGPKESDLLVFIGNGKSGCRQSAAGSSSCANSAAPASVIFT